MSDARLKWEPILVSAAGIVRGYDTPVTLRQLFYRLVAAAVISNTSSAYKTLSSRTAAARREESAHRPAASRGWIGASSKLT